MKCPKCHGEFEKGFTADRTGDIHLKTKSQWAKGTKFLVGLKEPHDVVTYRCISCGYLESYAK